MDIKNIKEFIVLSETLSFWETSERTYISLSSLSKHISRMEEELGVPLFDRTTRSVKLSKYGDAFVSYAKQISALYDEYSSMINDIRTEDNTTLSISFLPMLGQYGLVEMLSSFIKQFNCPLNIFENNQPRDLLNAGKCDFAFDAEYGESPAKGPEKRILYKTDQLVAVLPPSHPLASRTCVRIEELQNEEFIVHHDTVSMLPAYFDKLCRQAGFKPKITATVSFTSTIVKLVSQDIGISVMNRGHIPDSESVNVKLVDIVPSVPLNIYVYYLENTNHSSVWTQFYKHICESEIKQEPSDASDSTAFDPGSSK